MSKQNVHQKIINSQIVNNDGELFLAIAKLKKPIILKPLEDGAWEPQILPEIECQALLNFNQSFGPCQCNSEKFPPEYPFIIAEYRAD